MHHHTVAGARRFLSRALLGVSSFAVLLPAGAAWAQDSAEDVADNAIIVTAQRREEALEDVPMSIAVVSRDLLETSGVVSLRDLSRLVPGFQLGQSGGFPQPALRGVTSLINVQSFENNIAVYIDGYYQMAPQGIGIDLPNVESVQVLKGPQGTLYGRNATGGAILLNTIAPGDDWQGRAELTYARFDDKRAGGYVAGPLGEGLGVSVAGYTRRSDGYIKLVSRTVPGKVTDGNAAPLEQDSVQVKLKADLTDDLSATLGYHYIHTSDGRGNLFSPFENVSPTYRALAGGATRAVKLGTAAWDHGVQTATSQHQGTLTVSLNTGLGKLKSYTGYVAYESQAAFDFDGSYINLVWSTNAFRQKTFQQALDFNLDVIPNVDLVVGAQYINDRLRSMSPFTQSFSGTNSGAPGAPGAVPPTLADLVQTREQTFSQDKEAWAVYADATVQIGDSLSVNAGGRFSKEVQDVAGFASDPRNGAILFPATTRGSSYEKFTPRASIRYEVAPRTSVYASYSMGFRSGSWNAALPVAPANWLPADQETVDAFEVGFKTAGRAFNVELAGFYYDYKDIQVSLTQTIGSPPMPTTLISNAPRAKIYGIDASFQWTIAERLTLRGGAAWLHARYGDNFLFDGVGVNPASPGINVNKNPLKTYQNVTQVQDLSGLQMSRAPNFSANMGIDYLVPDGDGGLRMALNGNYTDSYVVTNPSIWGPLVAPESQSKQRFREGRHLLVSASVTWSDPSNHYFARLWGNNLTDHRYRLHYTGTSSFGTYSPMAEPMTYGLTLGYKFGAE